MLTAAFRIAVAPASRTRPSSSFSARATSGISSVSTGSHANRFGGGAGAGGCETDGGFWWPEQAPAHASTTAVTAATLDRRAPSATPYDILRSSHREAGSGSEGDSRSDGVLPIRVR